MSSITTQPQSVKLTASTIPIGAAFGRLTVVGTCTRTITKTGRYQYLYPCQCSCGNSKDVSGKNLLYGQSTSCGCMRRGRGREKHGGYGTRLYEIWAGMKQRCSNPKVDNWKHYGGRGIAVCDAWESFESFRDWALANGYLDGLTIDRTDTNGNYTPENCNWTTRKVQVRNKRNNHTVTAFGETHCLAEWAENARCTVTERTLLLRLIRGWDAEKAITAPLSYHRKDTSC